MDPNELSNQALVIANHAQDLAGEAGKLWTPGS